MAIPPAMYTPLMEQPASSWRRTRTIWLTLSVLFAAMVAGFYFALACRVGWRPCGALLGTAQELPTFFWIQLGLLALPAALSAVRPLWGGRALQVYLVGSTAALLAMPHHFRVPLALAACVGWACCAANTLRCAVRRWVGKEFASWEIATAALIALLTMACSLLAMAHALYRPIIIALAIALLLPGAIELWRRRGQWRMHWGPPFTAGPLECVLCEAIWLPLAITFVWACADEVWSDSTRVHLPYARQIMLEGGLPDRVAGDYFRLVPNAAQTAYAGFATASTFRLAKWFSWSALLCVALVAADEVGRFSRSRRAYLFTAAGVLGCPALIWESTSLYVDHFAVLFTTAAFVVLFRAHRFGRERGFWFSAALMGVAVQVKYTTCIAGAVWCVAAAVLIAHRHGLRSAILRFCALMAAFGACASPWYLRVWYATGNPVFPFLNGIFHSAYWPAGLSTDFNMEMFRLHGLGQWLAFPWIATFQTSRIVEGYDGWLGFWWLALLPFLFAAPSGARASRGLWLAGVAIVFGVSLKAPYLRYWLPAWPLMLIALIQCAACALERPAPRWLAAVAAPVALVGALLPLAVFTGGWGIYAPWLVYTRQTSREQWMTDRMPGYGAVADLNGQIDPGDGVLCLNYAGVSAVKARAFEFRESSPAVDAPAGFSDLAGYLARNRIRYWLVDHSRYGLAWYFQQGCGKYWTDDNIISASQGVAIYAIDAPSPRFLSLNHRDIPPTASEEGSAGSGWVASAALLRAIEGENNETIPIDSALEQTVLHRFAPSLETCLVRYAVPLRAERCYSGTGEVRLAIDWFDLPGNKIGSEFTAHLVQNPLPPEEARVHSAPKHGPFEPSNSEELACLYSLVPPGAAKAAISVTTYNARVRIQTACVTSWRAAPPMVAAAPSAAKRAAEQSNSAKVVLR